MSRRRRGSTGIKVCFMVSWFLVALCCVARVPRCPPERPRFRVSGLVGARVAGYPQATRPFWVETCSALRSWFSEAEQRGDECCFGGGMR